MSEEVISFSTKDILNYFMNLLNPQVFENIEDSTKKQLIAASNDLARIGKELEDTITPQIESLKRILAKEGSNPDVAPPKTEVKKLEAFNMVKEFSEKYLPNFNLQVDKLRKEHGVLVGDLDDITAYGKAAMDYNGLEELTKDIEKFDSSSMEAFRGLKENLDTLLGPCIQKVSATTGVSFSKEREYGSEIPTSDGSLAPHITGGKGQG